jgi:tetratricopeptide (TPR) repeat protein
MEGQAVTAGIAAFLHNPWLAKDFSPMIKRWLRGFDFATWTIRATISIRFMRKPVLPFAIVSALAAITLVISGPYYCAADSGPSNAPPISSSSGPGSSDAASAASQSNTIKAHALVDAAINMTNSDQAVRLLWQATDVDPTLEEPYVYLALFYNSRSQFDKEVEVYEKLVKYKPREISAYLNMGEAYMSYTPPKFDSALPFFRKALEIDPASSIAALRLGEIYAQEGNRNEAVRYLKVASADRVKNPTIASEADQMLHQIGGP